MAIPKPVTLPHGNSRGTKSKPFVPIASILKKSALQMQTF
jgi:hypothetical protein